MTTLIPSRHWTPAALMSVYVAYPNKQDRKTSLKRIEEALNRICDGEIDGQPRTQQQALEWLRQKTEEARVGYYGRERKWIPHSTTWYNQSRYLRPEIKDETLPEQLEACINILSCYPKMPGQPAIRANIQSFLPALHSIDRALRTVPMAELTARTKLYRKCVEEWPREELKYVPGAKRWYDESRWQQDESLWQRKPVGGYQDERSQIARILGS